MKSNPLRFASLRLPPGFAKKIIYYQRLLIVSHQFSSINCAGKNKRKTLKRRINPVVM